MGRESPNFLGGEATSALSEMVSLSNRQFSLQGHLDSLWSSRFPNLTGVHPMMALTHPGLTAAQAAQAAQQAQVYSGSSRSPFAGMLPGYVLANAGLPSPSAMAVMTSPFCGVPQAMTSSRHAMPRSHLFEHGGVGGGSGGGGVEAASHRSPCSSPSVESLRLKAKEHGVEAVITSRHLETVMTSSHHLDTASVTSRGFQERGIPVSIAS